MRRLRDLPILFAQAVVWSLILILLCTPCVGSDVDDLQAVLEIHSSEIVVGEPLVVTVGLRNPTDSPVKTVYARPGVFYLVSDVDITILSVAKGAAVRVRKGMPGDVVLCPGNPKWESLGPAIEAGGVVKSKKTVALVATTAGRLAWLGPGTYEVQAEIRLQGHAAPFRTSPERFTVKPLVPEQQGALSVFTADLAPLLEAGPDFSPQKVKEKVAELKKRFPQSPHRQYLEFHLLWALPTREEKVAKANAYIEEFPKSPYVDDVLWDLARMEREADEFEKAAAHLETLLRDYPDSPLKQEVEELQKKMKEAEEFHQKLKEARERAAEQKAAKEKEAALEGKPAPSEDKGTGPP
ncbi:MAG: hypothetical protein NTX40_00320 [Planctomycetota bacterium]|nr:hypothetical protein [Planctomycetota bacterium]